MRFRNRAKRKNFGNDVTSSPWRLGLAVRNFETVASQNLLWPESSEIFMRAHVFFLDESCHHLETLSQLSYLQEVIKTNLNKFKKMKNNLWFYSTALAFDESVNIP